MNHHESSSIIINHHQSSSIHNLSFDNAEGFGQHGLPETGIRDSLDADLADDRMIP